MSVIKISKALQDKLDVPEAVDKKLTSKIVTWILNYNYRRAVELSPWIKAQVKFPSYKVLEALKKIQTLKNHDDQVVEVLKWVENNVEYIPDQKSKWEMPDYWQTADETLTPNDKGFLKGDCEDGAILAYVLCRLKGIPANKLMILAGDVKGGGHCWLAYKPTDYPFNFAFLDWCYWYNRNNIGNRPLFTIVKKTINEYNSTNNYSPVALSNYRNIWVWFNEDKSNTELNYSGD